jgi:histidinol-phosphate aminotransferase
MRRNSEHSFRIRQEIERVSPYVPGKPIDEVKRELKIDDVIKLASNEMPFLLPEKVLEAIYRAAKNANRYPDSHSYYLRKRISEKFGIDENSIVFGNGSSELIKLIAEAIVVEGDRVVFATPSFVMYPIVTASRGGVSVEIELVEQDLSHDVDAMLAAVDESTSLVILCNPNNPTGTITGRDQVYRLLEGLPDGVFLLFDEAYAEFVDDPEFVSGVEVFKEGWPNVGVLRSFSKSYGLAGLRLGYGFLPEKLADAVNRIREPFNINIVAQEAALAALDCEEEFERMREEIISERKRLEKELTELGYKTFTSQANFIFVDAGVDSKDVFKELLKRGIIVRDGSIFGARYRTFLRVTVGTREENSRFLREFPDVVEALKRSDIR